MERSLFLKSAILTGGGILTGMINPLKALGKLNNSVVLNLPNLIVSYFPMIATYSRRRANACDCRAGSCSNNTAPTDVYFNTSYLWYVLNDTRFMYHEYLRDPNYDSSYLLNASVPFFANQDSPIMRLEGPSLLGLCFALKEHQDGYSRYPNVQPKDYLVPTKPISNAGYRFDTAPCEETKYKTKLGTTKITYEKGNGQQQATIHVKAEDDNTPGLIYHSRKYNFSI